MSEPKDRSVHRRLKRQADKLENLASESETRSSFSLNNALLSRLRVLTVNPLQAEDLRQILERFETKHTPLPLTSEAREHLIHYAQGDGRYLLNMVENLLHTSLQEIITPEILSTLIQRRSALYD